MHNGSVLCVSLARYPGVRLSFILDVIVSVLLGEIYIKMVDFE